MPSGRPARTPFHYRVPKPLPRKAESPADEGGSDAGGAADAAPLHKLGTQAWDKAKRRAMQQIVDYKNDPGNGYTNTLLCFMQLFIVSNRSDTWYFANNNSRHFAFNADERARLSALIQQDLTPRKILTPEAFDDAFALDMAMGGSTNTVLHLLATASEAGVDFTMQDIDRLSRKVPCLAKVAPATQKYHMEDVHRAGGVMAILGELARAHAAPLARLLPELALLAPAVDRGKRLRRIAVLDGHRRSYQIGGSRYRDGAYRRPNPNALR